MLYYVENVPGAWLDQANIKSVVIDETLGKLSLCYLAYNKARGLWKANRNAKIWTINENTANSYH